MSNKIITNGDDYIKKCASIVANGTSLVNINIGNHLGLFSALASFNGQPATSQQIADAVDCKERYVREWLNACSTSDLCEIDAEGKHYWLTPEACQAVTSRRFAETTVNGRFMEIFGSLAPEIEACFKKAGPPGLSYSLYERFGPARQKFTQYLVVDRMKTHVLPLLPTDLKQKLQNGFTKMLDVACGSGGTTCKWAELLPNCDVTGFDLDEEEVKIAQSRADARKLSNVKFAVSDAVHMHSYWTSLFDFVVITNALHDMARPDLCLQEILRVLKPGGFLLVLDVDAHTNPADNKGNRNTSIMYVASYCHCTPVSLYFPGGMGLGSCWGREKAKEMVTEAGFEVLKQGNDGPPGLQYLHARK